MLLDSQHHYPSFEQEDQVAGIANAELAIPPQLAEGWGVPALRLQAIAAPWTELEAVSEAVETTTLLLDVLQAGVQQGSVEFRSVFGEYLHQR